MAVNYQKQVRDSYAHWQLRGPVSLWAEDSCSIDMSRLKSDLSQDFNSSDWLLIFWMWPFATFQKTYDDKKALAQEQSDNQKNVFIHPVKRKTRIIQSQKKHAPFQFTNNTDIKLNYTSFGWVLSACVSIKICEERTALLLRTDEVNSLASKETEKADPDSCRVLVLTMDMEWCWCKNFECLCTHVKPNRMTDEEMLSAACPGRPLAHRALTCTKNGRCCCLTDYGPKIRVANQYFIFPVALHSEIVKSRLLHCAWSTSWPCDPLLSASMDFMTSDNLGSLTKHSVVLSFDEVAGAQGKLVCVLQYMCRETDTAQLGLVFIFVCRNAI